MVNALYNYKDKAKTVNSGLVYEYISKLLLMLAPFVPHITEELWNKTIDAEHSVHKEKWPTYEEDALKVDEVEILLQVNGKGKGRIMVPSESTKEELEKLAVEDPSVKAAVGDKKIVKVIGVPGRLVNIVVR